MESFIRETDMLEPIISGREAFISQRTAWESFFEIQTPQGVADIIFAVFSARRLRDRESWQVQPIQEKATLDAMLALSEALVIDRNEGAAHRPLTTSEISEKSFISPSHLRQKVLPHLVDAGWIERSAKAQWIAKHSYECPTTSMYAIEVKRSEWQRALMQAAPHTRFANKTYLAMDSGRLPKSTQILKQALQFAGVGMISVSAEHQAPLEMVLDPKRKNPATNERSLVAERVLAVRSSGGNAGEFGHVFGRWVTTSSGPDPRKSMLG
ncbi:Rrf2 family transcriptional regulator [Streptomyces sp. DK15]|uniref:hypothetical protein n=1 Tax=Streptomyces sp. DK15 TaxID=2957499 RepID=UPI0029B01972|nr:hypothetical protein [Streptomyces sp. DK15]MDX2393425.1 Rrf2 family transcriptional regulator [Streptomyces sp. DK15]